MILAAGRGERMRPLTDHTPKPLLIVQGLPLIEYHLLALKQAGYQRIVINHAWLGQQFEECLGDGNRFGLQIIYSAESPALETAGGIVNALPLLCQNDSECCFAVVNGDIYSDYDFNTLPVEIPSQSAHLVMVDNPLHNPSGDFYFRDGKLSDSGAEKLTFSGIACYHKDFFLGRNSGVEPLAPMFRAAIKVKKVSAQYFSGNWTDVGTPQRLNELNS